MKNFIKIFLKVNWITTLFFNFKYLGWKKGRRIPVLLFNKCNIRGKGQFTISDKCRFGMIKLGIKHEFSCISETGIYIYNGGIIEFKGSGIIGNGCVISVKKNAILSLGKNFGITGDIKIHCHEKILIGNNFSCSCNVLISDTDFHECINPDNGLKQPMTKPIEIGNNVWCCQQSIISKGSIIPDWVTIAQMSMTNKKYECSSYSILAGIPAKCINKKLIRKDISIINNLSKNWIITNGFNLFNQI